MKIGLVLPGNLYFCPYVKIYSKILDKQGVYYDILFWDKDGLNEKGGISFNKQYKYQNNRFFKLFPYLFYCSFLRRKINKNKYDKLVIFGPQIGILLYPFLKSKFKNKFILDYRDLSIEQTLMNPFKKLLSISFFNAISSPGFRKCLPCEFEYIISHNFNIELVKKALQIDNKVVCHINPIDVLTIGGIRDYESNLSIVNSLRNDNRFCIRFVGKGQAAKLIKCYVDNNHTNNIKFKGFYHKEEEEEFINECSFLNIYYPRIISHSTALSNRFYNALIYKKPMIVTSDSIQGDYVEQYSLGLSLRNCNDLADKLESYTRTLDRHLFVQNCNKLLAAFVNDYEIFRRKLLKFIEKC